MSEREVTFKAIKSLLAGKLGGTFDKLVNLHGLWRLAMPDISDPSFTKSSNMIGSRELFLPGEVVKAHP